MSVLWFLQGIRTPVLTYFFQFISALAEATVVLAVLCLLYWCVDRRLALGICVSFFTSLLLVQGLKIALRVDRPWILDPAFEPVAAATAGATGYSFPSGHTQTAASVLGYIAITSGRRRTKAICWALVGLVALSRLYLGVHTPADVLAAIALSLVVALLARRAMDGKWTALAVSIKLGVLAAAALAYALVLHRGSTIEARYLADCVKSAGGCLGCAVGWYLAQTRVTFDVDVPPGRLAARYALGLCGVLLVMVGLRAIPGGLFLDALRYMLVTLWVLALYPAIFNRFGEKKRTI